MEIALSGDSEDRKASSPSKIFNCQFSNDPIIFKRKNNFFIHPDAVQFGLIKGSLHDAPNYLLF